MLKSISIVMIILILVELVVALIASYGVNGHIFREEQDIGSAIRRLSSEKPATALVVKTCYVLILLEFLVVVVVKYLGVK